MLRPDRRIRRADATAFEAAKCIFRPAPRKLLRAAHKVVTYLHDNVDNQARKRGRMKVVTSREFNQDVSAAKRLARIEPLFVTDRGRPTHVLMSIDTFRRMQGQRESIVDLLALADPAPPEGDAAAARWRFDGD